MAPRFPSRGHTQAPGISGTKRPQERQLPGLCRSTFFGTVHFLCPGCKYTRLWYTQDSEVPQALDFYRLANQSRCNGFKVPLKPMQLVCAKRTGLGCITSQLLFTTGFGLTHLTCLASNWGFGADVRGFRLPNHRFARVLLCPSKSSTLT